MYVCVYCDIIDKSNNYSLYKYKMFKLVVLVLIINYSHGFNLSPIPNYILNLPPLTYYKEKTQSSYFGYQITLRRTSVIVSAPRLPALLDSQQNIEEPGGLFKCNIQEQRCEPYIIDDQGNNVKRDPPFNVMKKDNQWLGAAIDGGSMETDNFVACSPNIITVYQQNEAIYLFNGVCYLVQDTLTNGTNARVLAPLLIRSKLSTSANNMYYMFGQMGVSVHITENSEELLIGAPGILNWSGSVIRYKTPEFIDAPGMSRRDVDSVARTQRQDISRFDVEIANPSYWKQDNDSYFGYAVTSGYFIESTIKLLYVASAPQGNLQTGEVIIFDFVVHPNNVHDNLERTIKIYKKFVGDQMGEYFGNALLATDFNGDGLDDLAISAPFYGSKSSYNNGKVYIFLNEGGMSFTQQAPLYSSIETNGQFGLTLGKLGDINHDGFNDIAVGAPYEENGKVYIFLGSRTGILTKPSQIISAPAHSITPSLFGISLSKGVDIDNNEFNDFAIGSPNSETVNVYRAYPVVKIEATVIPEAAEINLNVTSSKLKTCWRYELNRGSTLPFNQFDIKLTVKLDPQLQRAKFVQNNLLDFVTTVPVKNINQCISADIILSHTIKDIFKPIQLEVHYELIKKFQEFTSFCEDCVAINPHDSAMSQSSIVFSTGCKEIRCVADLNIRSRVVDTKLPYILGSSRYLTIEYTVTNLGETAYSSQFRIDIPRIASFYKIPLNCYQEQFTLYCDLEKGKPFYQNEQISMVVLIGTTRLEGHELIINANVTSSSDELNPGDNYREDVIQLMEFSEIEIIGQSSIEQISVEEIGLKEFAITHYFEILNVGPSNIKQLNFVASLPIIYKTAFPFHVETIVNLSSIRTNCEYDGQIIEPTWSESFNITDDTPTGFNMIYIDNSQHGINYDPSKHGQEYDLNTDPNAGSEAALDGNYDGMMSLHGDGGFNTYNRYTREIRTHHNVSRRSVTKEYNTKFSNLPHNRMLYFNCTPTDDDQHHCVQAVFDIKNVRASDKRIKVSIRFMIDLETVDRLYTEVRDIFLMVTSARVEKLNDPAGNTMKIINIEPYTIVTKYVKAGTPIWAIIISILVGILTLAILSYVLYRCGFFRRAKKEEMETIARQSQALASQGGANETDDD